MVRGPWSVVRFARSAVGRRLLLGDDNLGLTLGWLVETKLGVALSIRLGGSRGPWSVVRGPWAVVRFARSAVGRRLLLGDDNLGLTLGWLVETKLGVALSIRRGGLRRQCSAAKAGLSGGPPRQPVGKPAGGGAMDARARRSGDERGEYLGERLASC